MKKLIVILLFISFGLCPTSAKVEGQEAEVCKVDSVDFSKLALTKENLYLVMNIIGIHHQDIVMKQALYETGHFSSNLCRNGNNLFGIKKGNRYAHYKHWSESVIAYRDKIQNRYRKGENYMSFLKRIRYARNPNYINKLKKV